MTTLAEQVQDEINRRVRELRRLQAKDGTWRFCFEVNVMTDTFMIMTLRALNIKDETLIHQLAHRLLLMQNTNGAWKAYKDEQVDHLTSTVLAYNALLFSKYADRTDERLIKVEQFILKHGSLTRIHFIAKWMLAVHGQYPWPNLGYIPPALLLPPNYARPNFFDLRCTCPFHSDDDLPE